MVNRRGVVIAKRQIAKSQAGVTHRSGILSKLEYGQHQHMLCYYIYIHIHKR